MSVCMHKCIKLILFLDFKKIFVTDCQMDDIRKVLKSKTPHCSLHPNLTNSLILTYRDLSCETTNASLRLPADLSIIFPKLEKLKIGWYSWNPSKCPIPIMDLNQEWPRSLSTIEIHNLPTTYLPAIHNSQVKHIDINGCAYLTHIANVSSLKSLETLTIHCEYKGFQDLPPNVFKENVKLKELNLNGNNISNIFADSLKGLVNLETIDLGYNRIHHIPSGNFLS